MQGKNILAIMLGAALGTSLRYYISIYTLTVNFPIGTLLENLSGSFLLGFLTSWFVYKKKPRMVKTWIRHWFMWLVYNNVDFFSRNGSFYFESVHLFRGAVYHSHDVWRGRKCSCRLAYWESSGKKGYREDEQTNGLIRLLVGGMLGAGSRYGVGLLIMKKIPHSPIPLSMLAVNIVGSFVLGAFYQLAFHDISSVNYNDSLFLFVAVGFCGAFTTFSTFSVEAFMLLRQRAWGLFILYVSLSIFGSIAAFTSGFLLFR